MINVLLVLLEALMSMRETALANATESKIIEVEDISMNFRWLFD